MRAVSLPPKDYAHLTPFDLPQTWALGYDMTGKVAVFRAWASQTGAILFQLASPHADLYVDGQDVVISIRPSTVSDLDPEVTWASVTAAHKRLDYSASVGTDVNTADYRVQGDLIVTPPGGGFTPTTA